MLDQGALRQRLLGLRARRFELDLGARQIEPGRDASVVALVDQFQRLGVGGFSLAQQRRFTVQAAQRDIAVGQLGLQDQLR